MAVAGEDFCIVAGVTRLASENALLSRKVSFITKINDHSMVLSTGFQADVRTVHKMLQARNVMYQHQHHKPMTLEALQRLVSNTLYYRRFFPYYTSTICAGLDKNGTGAVYSYDVIGCTERVGYDVAGTAESLITPVLDNQLKAASPLVFPPKKSVTNLPLEEALDLVKSAFVSAGERDTYTGDSVEIHVVTKDGITMETMSLKRD